MNEDKKTVLNKTTVIYCPDIECDSCTKLISRKLEKINGIESYNFSSDSVKIVHTKEINDDSLINIIIKSGFRASTEPFERKNFSERLRDYKENKKKYAIEELSIKYIVAIFFLMIFVEIIAYFGIFSKIPNFISNYGLWLLYLNISIAVIGGAIWHFYSHKPKVTCMTGMMIGMTISMQTGMMIGAILGATNGFFIGALVGMLLSVFAGVIMGNSGGFMGAMQGAMGGVMGGTMGPMITVMMFSDHLNIFMPFYVIINAFIAVGMIYMVYEEAVEGKVTKKKPIEFGIFASISFIVLSILVAIMIYGPKSPLVSF